MKSFGSTMTGAEVWMDPLRTSAADKWNTPVPAARVWQGLLQRSGAHRQTRWDKIYPCLQRIERGPF